MKRRRSSAQDIGGESKSSGPSLALNRFVGRIEEREHLIQETDVEGLKEMPGGPPHPHLPADRRDFVVTRDEAANSRAVDDGHAGKIEYDGPFALAQKA